MPYDEEAHAMPRIGPNALIRVGEAVRNLKGLPAERELFQDAGLGGYLDHPPRDMVPEAEVSALHQALFRKFTRKEAENILRVAGALTARYLLATRIPPWAQRIVRFLPRPLGGRLLLGAIRKNSWTFAGSADVTADLGAKPALLMDKCRLCSGPDATARPCHYHEATIETLFRALVSPRTQANLDAFSSRRAKRCAVEIAW